MAAMPRQSPGGHHIVLYIAVAVNDAVVRRALQDDIEPDRAAEL